MATSVASAPSSSILTALPARPPTPPREANHEADVSAKTVITERVLAFNPKLSLQTPPNTNSPTESDSSSGRARKRVEWSAHTEYREPAQYLDATKPSKPSPLVLTPSASSKPVKGILKPSSSPNPLASSLSNELDGTSTPVTIIEMLDSTIKQLAGSDRDSKLDAYMMLARALKASNNLPDRVALQDKMSLFMQFIQRDMTAKTENGSLDSSLVNHSLTLLATFLHFPAIASTLTVDFGVFVLETSMRAFEDEAIPKDVIRHLMQVVAFQNFPTKVMTSERVGRLLTALHKLDNHLKGKSIIMSRLHIYKRLVKQARSNMVAHSEWIQDMLTDMLSAVKDIRSQAIGVGLEAGFALRSDKQLMRSLTEIFQASYDDELYINFYIKRLQEMLKDKQTSSAVPQIWSVVNLFLRCPLDRWQYYGPWLTLVQSAFNMTDGSTKHEANYAWNRYVYLCLTDGKVNRKGISTLCQPLLSQLRRKLSPKQQEDAMKLRRAVIGGVCNLYYYAFAPMAEKYDPDMLWDITVHPIVALLLSRDGKTDAPSDSLVQAAKLLVGLLDVTTPRLWRQDRIVDPQPITPDELPAIDSKWTRQNCDKVMAALEPILLKKFLDLSNKESLVFRLWQALVSAITAASAKDIKVSDGTAKFVACSFGLLAKVFSQKTLATDNCQGSSKFLTSVGNFVQLLVEGLGLLPFTEKKLSMTIGNTFEPIATPSQRLDQAEKPKGVVKMPLQHLFIMLSVAPPGVQDDTELAEFFQSSFEIFLRGKSGKARVDMTRELLELIPRNSLAPYGPWRLASESVQAFLENGGPGRVTGMSSDRPLGPEYREMVSLLERGLTSHPKLPSSAWLSLFNHVSSHITSNFGDAGCALVVVEPLAKALLDFSWHPSEKHSSLVMEASKALLVSARVPKDRQAIEAARSKLWGAPPALSRSGASFDPYENLYKLVNRILDLAYLNDAFSDEEVSSAAKAVHTFCGNCLRQIGTKGLSRLQEGLCPLIQDGKGKLQQSVKPLLYITVSRTT